MVVEVISGYMLEFLIRIIPFPISLKAYPILVTIIHISCLQIQLYFAALSEK